MKDSFVLWLIVLMVLFFVVLFLVEREYFSRGRVFSFIGRKRQKKSTNRSVGTKLVDAIKSDDIGMHGIENHQNEETSDVKNAMSFSNYMRLNSTTGISHSLCGLLEENSYNE